ncbi:flagellar basal body L-ring protein, partial [Xanthomonas oryzae pv. oryzae]
MSRPPLLSSACLAATCSLLLGGCVAA